MTRRYSGVLMHISALPNKYGIGSFGKSAYQFVDFLKQSKQKYWQILPLNVTSYGDSPYQSFSAVALNPYFIDLELLVQDGLLSQAEIAKHRSNIASINYEKLYYTRYDLLYQAYKRFEVSCDYQAFINENSWLEDYALFMAIKKKHDDVSFIKWDEAYLNQDFNTIETFKTNYCDLIKFHKVMQYWAFSQWLSLKKYANDNGIKIIGDCPIYVSYDSVEVYKNPSLFDVDEKYNLVKVAGVPPDYFSKDGQLWGNPLYKWDNHAKSDYKWWRNRIKVLSKIYDVIRIDHFKGIDEYYAIDYGMKDGRVGQWLKGPGIELLNAIKQELGKCEIIAEDLGIITEQTRALIKDAGFDSMKVLQFSFDGKDDNPYLPSNISKNSIAYLGTHDNETVKSFLNNLTSEQKILIKKHYPNINNDNEVFKMIECLMSVNSHIVIIQMQDLLQMQDEGRMNIPGTLQDNWCLRFKEDYLSDDLVLKLSVFTTKYNRASI